jgi:hypothetical protein
MKAFTVLKTGAIVIFPSDVLNMPRALCFSSARDVVFSSEEIASSHLDKGFETVLYATPASCQKLAAELQSFEACVIIFDVILENSSFDAFNVPNTSRALSAGDAIPMDKEIILSHLNRGSEEMLYVAVARVPLGALVAELQVFEPWVITVLIISHPLFK